LILSISFLHSSLGPWAHSGSSKALFFLYSTHPVAGVLVSQFILRVLLMVLPIDGDLETMSDIIDLFSMHLVGFLLEKASIEVREHSGIFIHVFLFRL